LQWRKRSITNSAEQVKKEVLAAALRMQRSRARLEGSISRSIINAAERSKCSGASSITNAAERSITNAAERSKCSGTRVTNHRLKKMFIVLFQSAKKLPLTQLLKLKPNENQPIIDRRRHLFDGL